MVDDIPEGRRRVRLGGLKAIEREIEEIDRKISDYLNELEYLVVK